MSGELNLPPFLMHALDALSILPSNTEVIRKADGKWVAKSYNVDLTQALDNLGPFGVTRAKVYLLFPSASTSESGMYRVDFRTKLSILEQCGVFHSGCHTPITPIQWSEEDKMKLNIPKEATQFCWCYPPAGMDDLPLEKKQHLERYIKAQDPEFTFLAFGGYVYFSELPDGKLKMVRALALMQGGVGIAFGAPITWRGQFTAGLYKQNRFQPVTIRALKDIGLNQFCYINPSEQLTSDAGDETWVPSPHGGFVYLYNKNSEPHQLDRFFPQSPAALSSPSPLFPLSTSPPLGSPYLPSPLSTSSGSIQFSMVTPRSPNIESNNNNVNNNNNHCSNAPSTPSLQITGSTPRTPSTPIAINRAGYPQTPAVYTATSPPHMSPSPMSSPLTPVMLPMTTGSPTTHGTPMSTPTPTTHVTPTTTPSPPTPPTSPSFTCVICFDRPIGVLIIPCKHLCTCTECAAQIKEYCPLCRGEIKDKLDVYL